MHSTKTEILTLLKRADGATVDDLASALGLASMTVRQHLTALERDDLVRAEEVRRPTGRPHFCFRLTDEGHRRISDGYDRLVALLLDEAGHAEAEAAGEPERRRESLVRRAAAALAGRHRADVRALGGDEQMERIVAVLRSHGGFAEWHAIDGGFELRDFNCVIRANVASDGPCAWHETFLTEILGSPVERAEAPGDGCAACCRYLIPARVPVTNRG